MMLGDGNTKVQDIVMKMYSDKTLKCDAVQVTHHNYNDIAPLYAKIGAGLALIPNSPENAGPQSGNAHKYKGIVDAAENVTVLYADPYTYRIVVESGEFKYEALPSYRESFRLAPWPDLDEGLAVGKGSRRAVLEEVRNKKPLRPYLIDRSVIATDAVDVAEAGYLVFDGSNSTKYCTNILPAVISWTMKKPVTVEAYIISSANDNETYKGRNPQKWVLCGSMDGEKWELVDAVEKADLPDENFASFAFITTNPTPYRYYVLKIFESGGSEVIQISELELYGQD